MESHKPSTLTNEATIGLGVSLLVFVWIFCKFRENNYKPKLPPGPRPWPVLGSLHLLGNLPHQYLANIAKKYGPLMFLRLGSIPTVVVSSPSMAKEFLKTHDLLFANRPNCAAGKYLTYDYKDVAFAHYGEYWRQMRKLCTVDLLTAKRVESFKFVREEEVSAMISSIWEASERGVRSVDLSKSVSSLTQNIMCRMFASRTFSDHHLVGGHRFKATVDELLATSGAFCVGDFIPWLDWLDLQGIHRRMKKAHQVFDKFAEEVIDEHIYNRRNLEGQGQKSRVKDFVDLLLDAAEAESGAVGMKITRVHMKAIIADLFNAGTESSSTTIVWAMSELQRNRRVLARVQEELESAVGRHCLVKESDVACCEYLKCVVKETFRIHPPGPFLVPHESTEGCSIGGFYIPSKTRLLVNVWAIGRDERVWEDPEEFKPERFMGKDIDVRGQHFELLPFGAGRRGCPAIYMGLSVVEFALAQLVHCFDWTVEGELNMDEVFGLTVPRKYPLLARPAWRLTSGRV
uniref:TSA: Wollemia nobilis Ref_Wollemi_Transcript_13717_1676 transcribed RNA sequence n=1 Tax=Wollemia nobilis TaxID=56998 RepID=A0A0C9QQU3_9CONI